MKPTGSFSTTSSAGILLALVLVTGAAHSRSLSCIGCELTTSYQAAVRVYDKARTWGLIARWWIDPEYAPAVPDKKTPVKVEDVCQMRSTSVTAR